MTNSNKQTAQTESNSTGDIDSAHTISPALGADTLPCAALSVVKSMASGCSGLSIVCDCLSIVSIIADHQLIIVIIGDRDAQSCVTLKLM